MTDLDLDDLVQSARQVDQPSAAQADQLFARVAESVKAAGGAAGASAAAGTSAATKVGATVLGLVGAAGVVYVNLPSEEPQAARPARLEPSEAAAPVAPPERPPSTPAVEPAAVNDGPKASPMQETRQLRPNVEAARPSLAEAEPADTLSEEVSLLRRAKMALDAKRPKRALELLDSYDQKFPQGTLRTEAQATRVLSHCALNQLSTAQSTAKNLDENSPLGKKMLQGCPRSPNSP